MTSAPSRDVRELTLIGFKAFQRFTITFGSEVFLVGPNNAGKSTIISALRASAQMLRIAAQRTPDTSVSDASYTGSAYTFDTERLGLVAENLRHEFREIESRLVVRFRHGACITAVWPVASEDEEDDPYFYLTAADGVYVTTPKAVRTIFPEIGIVPILSPIERDEAILDAKYVRSQQSGRLASRHFRNHLYMLDASDPSESFEAFRTWAREWCPDVDICALDTRLDGRGQLSLDVFYTESGAKTEREVYWAGDGFQIWLQLLVHVFRLRSREIIVLDEPDVYLHADLQRRLVRLLESLDGQTITATHSAEVLTEAAGEAIVWVDRTRRRAVRAPAGSMLTDLANSMGSRFNLQLARALRARLVLCVEGTDVVILREFAGTLGASMFAQEQGLAVVPLEGYTNWTNVEPFKWLVDGLLERAVPVWVVLDRDYRTQEQVSAVVSELAQIDVKARVWRRKEIENYLINAPTLARLSGASVDAVETLLDDIAAELRPVVFARLAHERLRGVKATKHQVSVMEAVSEEFERLWSDTSRRLALCPAKDVLSQLNARLTAEGFKAMGARRIARSMRAAEIADEVVDLITEVEAVLHESASAR